MKPYSQSRSSLRQEREVVLDFAQNIVGYVSFEFDEQEGKKLTLIHGEVLDGNFQS